MILNDYQHAEQLDTFFRSPLLYLSITGNTSDTTEGVARYINAEVTNVVAVLAPLPVDKPAWVAIVPKHQAQFYADRLASGLIGAKVHDSFAEAVERIAELAFD